MVTAHTELAPRRSRALVIDDDPAVLKVLTAALAARSIDVVVARDGISGLRTLVDELLSLDLLVTDLVMPTLSGASLVRTIRQLGGERDLPIVVVSGALDAERTAELRAAGADAVVEKQQGPLVIAEMAAGLLAARRPRPAPRPAPALPVARLALKPLG